MANFVSFRTWITAFLLAVAFVFPVKAQYVTYEWNPYHKAYHDSLKKREYPYKLPFLAKRAYKRGIDIPYTYGISMAAYSQRQSIRIDKMSIGINDLGPVDMSGFISFGEIENTTNAFTVRPDMWVLPFLNVYGIFGVGHSRTKVPLVAPVNFSTTQDFSASSMGVGMTLAGGVGPVVVIVDNNINYANVEALSEPVPAYNLDIRIGHNFVNPVRADRGMTVWIGAFYQRITGDTHGSIQVRDLFPNGIENAEANFVERLEEWADGLPLAQQIVANQIVRKVDDYLQGHDLGNTEIRYELDKSVARPWNLIFGAQYQHNKNWQLRTEIGTYGKRTSFLLMLNYRFESLKRHR